MFFMLYFVASLQCIFWTKTVGEGETIDLKFLSFLMVIELLAVKDISLIIGNAYWNYIFLTLKFSTVSNVTQVTIFEF